MKENDGVTVTEYTSCILSKYCGVAANYDGKPTTYECPSGVKDAPVREERHHADPLTEEETQEEYMSFQGKYYRVDDEHGPLHYRPYPGGLKFPVYETITDKPGFKIWVDGGVLDYEQEVCYAKMLDCSATCCLQSYCGPSMADCTVYSRRPYSELYIGVLVMLTLVAGIPTVIKIIEFAI